MAFQLNSALLGEIKQGFKLRPTTTVDKSAPIIQAEDEELTTLKYVKPDKPADLSYLFIKKDPDDIVVWRPRSIVPPPIIHKGAPVNGNVTHSRPTTPNPPAGKPVTNPTLLKLGGAVQQDVDRNALLNSIKGGIKLRKTVTNDRSGFIMNDEVLSDLQNRGKTSPSQDHETTNGNVSSPPASTVSSTKTSSTDSSKPKPKRKKSAAKPKAEPAASKNFVPATLSTSAPPPPPPMMIPPVSKPLATNSAPIVNKAAPPPPPPPPAAPMPKSLTTNSTPKVINTPQISRPPSVQELPKPEPPKADVEYNEKNLYVTKENLEAEIKKGAAMSRIAMFKQFEQTGAKAPMPKTLPGIQPGKLKIIENTSKDAPITNGRLKIHEGPASPTKKTEKAEPKASISPTSRKYSVPITVKTDEPPTPTSPKKSSPKKLSNGKIKKTPASPKTNTLSPSTTRPESLSPSAASNSSAYQSGISSPTSISSISPNSKSSGISSTASSVSPPVRTSSILNGVNGTTKEKEKTPPPKTARSPSITSERFSQLRQSFSEKTPEPPKPMTSTIAEKAKKAEETGEHFWKAAASKSNGVTSPKATPVEIKTPWLSKTYSNQNIPKSNESKSTYEPKTTESKSTYEPKTSTRSYEPRSYESRSNYEPKTSTRSYEPKSYESRSSYEPKTSSYTSKYPSSYNYESKSSTTSRPKYTPSYTRTTAYEPLRNSSSSSSYTPMRTSITTKKPPAVPPKRAPISISITRNFSDDEDSNSSYLDDPLEFAQRYKFDIDFTRAETVEIVQR